MSLWKRIRGGRLLWTLFVTLYFVNFFHTLFSDALGPVALPAPGIILCHHTPLWMAVPEYIPPSSLPFFPVRCGRAVPALERPSVRTSSITRLPGLLGVADNVRTHGRRDMGAPPW